MQMNQEQNSTSVEGERERKESSESSLPSSVTASQDGNNDVTTMDLSSSNTTTMDLSSSNTATSASSLSVGETTSASSESGDAVMADSSEENSEPLEFVDISPGQAKRRVEKTNLINQNEWLQECECGICRRCLHRPVLTDCGHHFCKKCVKETLNDNCPMCNSVIMDTFGDVKQDRKIDNIAIKCPNGCDWKGTIKELQEHLSNDCSLEPVPCLWNCEVSPKRQSLLAHRESCPCRVVQCTNCKCSLPFNNLEAHAESCPKYPITCPNQCGKTITREDTKGHLQECLLQTISCPYASFGCDWKDTRNLLAEHTGNPGDQAKHMDFLRCSITKIQKHGTKPYVKRFTFEVPDYVEKTETSDLYESPSFYLGDHKFCICYRPGNFHRKQTYLSAYLVMKGKSQPGPWSLPVSLTLSVLNQQQDTDHLTSKLFCYEFSDTTNTPSCGSRKCFRNRDITSDTDKYLPGGTLVMTAKLKAWLECDD